MRDLSTEKMLALLSQPDRSAWSISRRRFLQMALAGGVVAAVPPVLVGAGAGHAAAQVGPNDGILVVVLMGGGNDGLNTLVPYGDGAYHDAYGSLALGGDRVLALDDRLGLHPSLAGVKGRYDAGKVALIQGVGYVEPNLSHFESMAIWMSGWAGGIASTGWLGRYLSGRGAPDPFGAVVFDGAVPLHFRGPTTSALSMPTRIGGAVGWLPDDPHDVDHDLLALLGSFDDAASEHGHWANAWNAALGDLVELGSQT